jgi:hypothetical protein
MKYIIYKITNLINGKIYIGKHTTNDIHDSYMGSSKILNLAFKKYGIENFKKEILYIFDSEEEMNKMERFLINEEFVKRKDAYNLNLGGAGSWYFAGKRGLKIRDEKLQDPIYRKIYSDNCSLAGSKYYKDNGFGTFKNRKHSKKTKLKMSKRKKGKYTKEENSQFGTIWIYHPLDMVNKKIKKDDLLQYLERGWTKGRKTNLIWICNKELNQSKMIKKNELNTYLSIGWKRGNLVALFRSKEQWIYHPIEMINKKIKTKELENYLKLGWIKGRKIKF